MGVRFLLVSDDGRERSIQATTTGELISRVHKEALHLMTEGMLHTFSLSIVSDSGVKEALMVGMPAKLPYVFDLTSRNADKWIHKKNELELNRTS